MRIQMVGNILARFKTDLANTKKRPALNGFHSSGPPGLCAPPYVSSSGSPAHLFHCQNCQLSTLLLQFSLPTWFSHCFQPLAWVRSRSWSSSPRSPCQHPPPFASASLLQLAPCQKICESSWTVSVAQVVSKPHLFITFLLPDFHLLLMQLEFPVLNIQSKLSAFWKCNLNLFACSWLRHPYLSNSCWIFSTRCSIDFSNSSVFFWLFSFISL